MLQIEFRFSENLPGFTGRCSFDLGDLFLRGNLGSASSVSRTPDQSMMVVLSATCLLDGLRHFLADPDERKYRFSGIGSSFSTEFTKSGEMIMVSSGGNEIEKSTVNEVIWSVLQSMPDFIATCKREIVPPDGGLQDLLTSFDKFKQSCERQLGDTAERE